MLIRGINVFALGDSRAQLSLPGPTFQSVRIRDTVAPRDLPQLVHVAAARREGRGALVILHLLLLYCFLFQLNLSATSLVSLSLKSVNLS